MEIIKLPIMYFVQWFVIYLVMHVILGLLKNKAEKDLQGIINDVDLQNKAKYFNLAFKWFPAAYLILIIIIFYNF